MSPVLTGSLAAGGSVVVLLLGALLYRVVPAERRKTVSVTMMGVGGLMLGGVLLRSWEVLEADPVTDAIVVGFLIGGFVVCSTGFALYRQITRAGD